MPDAPAASPDAPAARDSPERRVLLSLRAVSKIYRMGEVDVPALRDATLDIFDGEFVVVMGSSGSGKSTLLNLIGGMDQPTSGEVLFEGQDLAKASDARLTAYRREAVGFVFQFYNLIPTLTALENVQVALESSRRRERSPMNPQEALEMVGLADRAHHFPAQLSGGQQQRVAIARAMAGNPRLLLCDEPTGALDAAASKQVLSLLWDLNRRLGKTVALITHEPVIRTIADRAIILHDGAVARVEVNESPVSPENLVL
jgi:putative ABC transport system ATP-binding protein